MAFPVKAGDIHTFPVKAGDIHTFKTNEAPKYGKNMKCKVNYIMEASCNMMEMSCMKMELGDRDFLYVKTDNFTKKYENHHYRPCIAQKNKRKYNCRCLIS